jgi:hypothetical protein
MKPKNAFRIKGKVVYIRLKNGGGKETVIDWEDWQSVQEHEWLLHQTNGKEFAAAFIVEPGGLRHFVYLHDFIVARMIAARN